MSKIGTSKRGKLNNKIHDEMRRIAIRRHPYCVVCGRSDGILQGGHLIPKASSTAVRYDLMNVFTQCVGCNSLHRFNPHPFIGWFINEYGVDEYNDLIARSKKKVVPIKIVELEAILENYKNI
jgi:hypothetical protein